MNFELPTSISVVNPIHLDKRYGPHASVAAAKSAVPAAIRIKGLTVGVLTSGVVSEYWWKSGTTDGDLVAKTDGSTVATDGVTIGGDGSVGSPLYAITSGISGVYTPTVIGLVNLTSATPSIAMYFQVGDIVAVHGSVDYVVDGGPSTNREVHLELPIASTFTLATDVSGVVTGGTSGTGNVVYAGFTSSAYAITNIKEATSGTYFYSYFYKVYPM